MNSCLKTKLNKAKTTIKKEKQAGSVVGREEVRAASPAWITVKIVTAFLLGGCCLVSYMGSAVFSLVAERGGMVAEKE